MTYKDIASGDVIRMEQEGKMDRCPHIISKRAGDESRDFCELTERPSGRIKMCLLEEGLECETWKEIQAEWEAEGKQ